MEEKEKDEMEEQQQVKVYGVPSVAFLLRLEEEGSQFTVLFQMFGICSWITGGLGVISVHLGGTLAGSTI